MVAECQEKQYLRSASFVSTFPYLQLGICWTYYSERFFWVDFISNFLKRREIENREEQFHRNL